MEYRFDDNTQYFVVSDLHGQGKIYDAIIYFLEKELKTTGKKTVLIIDGDLIDRGNDSIRMLVDVMKRVKHQKGNIEVVMLPGNHELMMCQALEYFRVHREFDKGTTENNIWFHPDNHGTETWNEFLKEPQTTQREILDFLKSLPLYCRIKTDNPNNNSFVIVHALPPSNAMTSRGIPTIDRIITDDNYKILRECLTFRKKDGDSDICLPEKGVITIIGRTPVENSNGFSIEENKKLLMIDGGCAYMAANPDSKIFPEMASLLKLSDVPGKTVRYSFGDGETKNLREARRQ